MQRLFQRSFSRSAVRAVQPTLPRPVQCTRPVTQQKPLDMSLATDLITSQSSLYAVFALKNTKYTVTPHDVVTLPYQRHWRAGDRIKMTRVTEVGSRDFALRATPQTARSDKPSPYVDANLMFQERRDASPRNWQQAPNALDYLSPDIVSVELRVLEHIRSSYRRSRIPTRQHRKRDRIPPNDHLPFTRAVVSDISIKAPENSVYDVGSVAESLKGDNSLAHVDQFRADLKHEAKRQLVRLLREASFKRRAALSRRRAPSYYKSLFRAHMKHTSPFVRR